MFFDVALILEKLVPAAKYGGSLSGNNEESYNQLRWNDERPKPSWQEILDEYKILDLQDAIKKKITDLTNYYNTYSNCQIVLYTDNWTASTFTMNDKSSFMAMKDSMTEFIIYGDDKKGLKYIDTTTIAPIIKSIENRNADSFVAYKIHEEKIKDLLTIEEIKAYDFTVEVPWDGKSSKIETEDFRIDITRYLHPTYHPKLHKTKKRK